MELITHQHHIVWIVAGCGALDSLWHNGAPGHATDIECKTYWLIDWIFLSGCKIMSYFYLLWLHKSNNYCMLW